MDMNEVMNNYKNVNQHIDDLNKFNQNDYDTKMGTAEGKEFVKGLIGKGKATKEIVDGVSATSKSIIDKQAQAAKVAKAGKLMGAESEGDIELSDLGQNMANDSSGAKTGSRLIDGGEVAADALNDAADVGRLASVGKSAIGALSKGGSVLGIGMGAYDVGEDIYNDIKNKKIGITGNNWQEKMGHVGEEISGGLDAAGLALGPEFLLAGAVVGGVSEIMNLWGGSKDHEGVPEPPKPVVESNVAPPNFAALGMVQNHNNNIKQFTN